MNTAATRSPPAPRLLVLGTGGTIAGRAATPGDRFGYVAGQVAVADLLQGIPVPEGATVQAEQLANIDSKDMDPTVWKALLHRVSVALADAAVDGIVITHGTDTLEETAFLLQLLLAPRKPVVLTCAMRPATALVPDGPQNLADALRVAAEPGAAGVLMAAAGEVHEGWRVQKVHTHRLNAFDSGDAGPVAEVVAGGVRRFRPWPEPDVARQGWPLSPAAGGGAGWPDVTSVCAAAHWPRVDIALSHGGADGQAVADALAASRALPVHDPRRLRGLVVAGTGGGTLNRSLEGALDAAQGAGVWVWRTTRCAYGQARAGEEGTWPPVAPQSATKARLALQMALLAVA